MKSLEPNFQAQFLGEPLSGQECLMEGLGLTRRGAETFMKMSGAKNCPAEAIPILTAGIMSLNKLASIRMAWKKN